MKYYKIGELSKAMGVSPDFIKYYERNGIIKSIDGEKTKLYDFLQSSLIIDCIKYKNYECNTKEIMSLINEGLLLDKHQQVLSKRKSISKEVMKKNGFLEYIEKFEHWQRENKETKIPYSIKMIDSFYFLKHTNNRDFIDDDNIYSIIKDWVNLVPICKSCSYLKEDKDGTKHRTWGLMLEEKDIEKYEVKTNDASSYVKRQKAVVVSVYGKEESECRQSIDSDVADKFLQLGIELSGESYFVIYERLNESGVKKLYGDIYYLIKE